MPSRPFRIGLVTGVGEELDAFGVGFSRNVTDGVVTITRSEPTATTTAPSTSDGPPDQTTAPVWWEAVGICQGIGKVNAAVAATSLLLTHEVDMLAVVGTAGNIGGLPPGPYMLHEAVQADYGARRSGGFVSYRAGTWPIGVPNQEPFRSDMAAALLAQEPSLPTARVATGDLFIEDTGHSKWLFETFGAGLVDMETAAVAQVAETHGVGWLAVKAASDDANSDSADAFQTNLQLAATQAAELLVALLDRLAQRSDTSAP